MALRTSVLVSAAQALGWPQIATEIEGGSVIGVALRRRVQAMLGPIVRQIQDIPDARPATATDAYWVTALDRDRNRHAFLAGPFPTHGAALEQVPEVKRWLDQSFGHDMDATFAAVGTAFGARSNIPVFLPGGTVNPTWETRARAAGSSGEAPAAARPAAGSRDAEVHAEYRENTLEMIKQAKLASRIPLRLARYGFLGFGAPTIEATPDTYLDVGRDAQAACRLTFRSARNTEDSFVLTFAVAENDTYTLQAARLYRGQTDVADTVRDRLGSFDVDPIREDMYLDQASDPDVLLPERWLTTLLPPWQIQDLDVGTAVPPGSRALVSALIAGGLDVFLRSDRTRIRIPGGTWEDLEILKIPYPMPVAIKADHPRALVVQHVSGGDLDNQSLILMREVRPDSGRYTLESVVHTAVGWKLAPVWKEDSSFAKLWSKNLVDQGHIARLRDHVSLLIQAPAPAPRAPTPGPKVGPVTGPKVGPTAGPVPARVYLSPHAKTPGTEDLYTVPVGSIARESVLAHGAKKAGHTDDRRRFVAKVRPNRWRFLVLEAGPTAKEDRTYRAMTGLSVAQQKKVDRYLDAHPEVQDGEDIPPSARREIAGAEEHESFDSALSRFVSDRASERAQWTPVRVGKAELVPAPRLHLDTTVFSDDEVALLLPYLLIRGDGDAGEETLFQRYQEAVRLEASLPTQAPPGTPDAWRRPSAFERLPVLVGTNGKNKWRVCLNLDGAEGEEEKVTTAEFVYRLGHLPGGPLLRGACALAFFMVANDANIRGEKVHELNAEVSRAHHSRVGNPRVKLSEVLQKGEIPVSRFTPLWSFYLGEAEPGYVWWARIVDDTLEREDYLRVMAGSRPGDYHVEGGTWTGPEEAAEPHTVWHWRPAWWPSLGDQGYPTLRLTFGPTGVALQTITGPEVKPGPTTEDSPRPGGSLRNKDLIYLLQTVVLNNGDTAALAPLGSPDSPEMRYLLDRGFLLPPVARGPGRFRITPEGERALATGAGLPNAIGPGGKSLDRPLGWPAFSAELTFRYAVEARAALHNRDLDNEGRWFRAIELNKLALRATDLPGASESEAKEILAYTLATQGLLQADPGDSVGTADPLTLDPVDFVTMVRTEDDGWRVKLFPKGFEGGDGLPRAVLEWRRGEIWSGRVNAPQVGRVSLKTEDEEAYRARTAAGIYSRLARQAHEAGKALPDHAIPMLGLNVQIEREPSRHVFPVPSVGSMAEDFPGAWRGRWGLINTRNNTAAGSYPSYAEARAAADREVARDQEWKASVAAEKAKFPVLNVDPKDPKSGYIKRLTSYGSHSQFWEAPHVADIRQPHGHDVQVHVLGNRLTRSHAYNAGSHHDLLLFTVDVPRLGDALVWRDTDEARKVKANLERSGIQVGPTQKSSSPGELSTAPAGSYVGYVFAVQLREGTPTLLIYPLREQGDAEALKPIIRDLPDRLGYGAIGLQRPLAEEVEITRSRWIVDHPKQKVLAKNVVYVLPEAQDPGASGELTLPPVIPAVAEISTYGSEAAKNFPKGTVAYKLSYGSPGMVLAKEALLAQGWRTDDRPRAHYTYVVPPDGKPIGRSSIRIQIQAPTRAAFEAWADSVIAERGRNGAPATRRLPADFGLGVATYEPEKRTSVTVGRLRYAGEVDDGSRETHTTTNPARVVWYYPGGDISREYPAEGPPVTHDATYTSVMSFPKPAGSAPEPAGPGPERVEQEGCFDTTLSVPGVGQVQVSCGAVGKRDTWANITVGSTRYGWNGSRWARGQIPSQTILRAIREAGITVFPGPSS